MRRVALLLACSLAIAACGEDASSDRGGADGEITAVASFYPLAEALRQVGGDGVDVTDLTPPGAEPHDLELTTDQADALLDADLVVVLGGGFQPAVEEIVEQRDGGTVVVLDRLDVAGDDPHVWLDPMLMADVARAVANGLAEVDPDGGRSYAESAAAYILDLTELDAELETGLATCERRTVVTAHAAFGHLTDRYGLQQESIAGIEPDQEPDARRLDELADLAEREGVTTIFTEALVSPEVAEALARETGLETAVLDPLEGEPADGDYLSVMRDNLAALRVALGCS